jgi:hypothetical protein
MSLQNGLGNTQSRVNIDTAVIGKLVMDIRMSEAAKLQMNTERTEESLTLGRKYCVNFYNINFGNLFFVLFLALIFLYKILPALG